MIIILTGQPNSGKTTLALTLETLLTKTNRTAVTIDGDTLRSISNNKDYSISGRKSNVRLAIEMAKTSNKLYNYTIMSLVSPFRNLRDSLKNDSTHIVKEVYLHSNRLREGKMVPWPSIKEDFKHFKEFTVGNTIVVGKNTFDTLPLLKNRECLVLVKEDKIMAANPNQYLVNNNSMTGQLITMTDFESYSQFRKDYLIVAGGAKTYIKHIKKL